MFGFVMTNIATTVVVSFPVSLDTSQWHCQPARDAWEKHLGSQISHFQPQCSTVGTVRTNIAEAEVSFLFLHKTHSSACLRLLGGNGVLFAHAMGKKKQSSLNFVISPTCRDKKWGKHSS